MAPRLALLVACSALAVSAGSCAILLDLPAPELGDGGPTVEGSAPQPDASDATAADATMDTRADSRADTAPDQGSQDTSAQDSAQEAAMEAEVPDVAWINASDSGVLCSLTLGIFCDQDSSLPDCCEMATDSSASPSFKCVALNGCSNGYDIQCTNNGECTGSQICCHYASGMRCESQSGSASSCPGGSVTQACSPSIPDECPQNQSCSLPLTNNGMPSPYLGCQ